MSTNKEAFCDIGTGKNISECDSVSRLRLPFGVIKSRRYNPYHSMKRPDLKINTETISSIKNENHEKSIPDTDLKNNLLHMSPIYEICENSRDFLLSSQDDQIPCNQIENCVPSPMNNHSSGSSIINDLSQCFQESKNMTPKAESNVNCDDMFIENTPPKYTQRGTKSFSFSFSERLQSQSKCTSTPLIKKDIRLRKIKSEIEEPLQELFKEPSVKIKLDESVTKHNRNPQPGTSYEDLRESHSKNLQNVTLNDNYNAENLSQIFKSTHYRKEILDTFDACETSICQVNQTVDDICNDPVPNEMCQLNETSDSFMLNIPENEFKIENKLVLETKPKKSHIQSKQFTGPFYGLPLLAKTLVAQYKGIDKLYDWQHECLTLPAIGKRQNLIYALPTSGGKTLVAEIIMLREVVCRKKNVLFVLPFVSIVQEKVWGLSPFAVGLEFLVEEYAAGKGVFPPRKRRNKKSIYIATLEKALGLVRSLLETNRLGELGLIVVDELHLLGEQTRGCTLEMLLTNVMYSGEDIQIVGMSATIGNIDELAKFMDAIVFTRDFRPVELKEYIKLGQDLMAIDWNTKETNDRVSFDRRVDYEYSQSIAKIDPDQLGGLVMEIIPKGSCLIFCPTKKNCENVANLLRRVLFKSLLEYRAEEKKALIEGLKAEGGGEDGLVSLLPWGIAYHHSGLAADERRLIEDAFRSGILSVICCTSTLAAGVNLPAQRVILRAPLVGKNFINLSTYKQMVGRAGRAGYGGHGDSILICPSNQIERVYQLISSSMDKACSHLHSNDGANMRSLLIGAIALGTATNHTKLRKLVESTLLSVQAERLNVQLKTLTDQTIEILLKMKVVHVKNQSSNDLQNVSISMNQSDKSISSVGKVSLANTNTKYITVSGQTEFIVSALGKAAVKGCIELRHATQLYEDLKLAQNGLVLIGVLHLLYLVCPYDLVENIKPDLPTYYRIYMSMGNEGVQTAKILGITEFVAVQMAKGKIAKSISEQVLNRFYVALMLQDLWNLDSLQLVSEKYQVNRGMVQTLMSSAANFSSCVLRFCEELPEFWAFKDLLTPFTQRLSHCCVQEILPLMELPNVRKTRAMQLYKAGYKSIKGIAQANPVDLMESIEHMNKNVANQLIAAAKLLLLEKVENLREEAEDFMEGLGGKLHI